MYQNGCSKDQTVVIGPLFELHSCCQMSLVFVFLKIVTTLKNMLLILQFEPFLLDSYNFELHSCCQIVNNDFCEF